MKKDGNIERMESELKEFRLRTDKLDSFLFTDKFMSLSKADQNLLEWQHEVMKQYCQILEVRIELTKMKGKK